MTPQNIIEKMQMALQEDNLAELHLLLKKTNALDIAEFLQQLPMEKSLVIFRMLTKETALYVFSHLDDAVQQKLVSTITDKELAYIANNLWVDDTVDMLEEMPATLVKRVLQNSSPEVRAVINQYL